MLTLERLRSAYAVNKAALDVAEKKLDEEIDKLNAQVRAEKLPKEDAKDTALKSARSYKQWVECLDLLIKATEKKGSDLTDEEAKIALCKARQYPEFRVKAGKDKLFSKSLPNVDYDISSLLKKLEIDVGFKYDITLLAVTLTYGISKLLKEKDVEACFSDYNMKETFHTRLQDEKVRKKIRDGANLGSHRCAEKALQDVINAFLPSVNYKATERDSAWFLLGATSLDKKTLGGIKVAPYKTIEKMLYDCISLKLKNNGLAQYTVSYKQYKDKEDTQLPEDKPEETAEKSAAPEEKAEPKQEKPKRERQPKSEKAAAKQSKEPAAKTGKGGRGKSKTEVAA